MRRMWGKKLKEKRTSFALCSAILASRAHHHARLTVSNQGRLVTCSGKFPKKQEKRQQAEQKHRFLKPNGLES